MNLLFFWCLLFCLDTSYIILFSDARHQLVPDEELGPLYDLLIDDPPEIRRAIGALVYDHLIAQKFQSSQSTGFFCLILYILNISLLSICSHLKCCTGGSSDSSEVHLKRMLQILAEFSTDQILSKYVIDDVWEYMDAMKVRLLIEQLNCGYLFITWMCA